MDLIDMCRTPAMAAPVLVRRPGSETDLITELSLLIERLKRPALLLRTDRTVLHMNAAGRALPASDLPITLVDGRLAGFKGQASHSVCAILREASCGITTHALITPGRPTAVEGSGTDILWTCAAGPVAPPLTEAASRSHAVQLVLRRPMIDAPRLSSIAQLYDLTEAELRVVHLLAHGLRPKCVAAQCGTALSTVRTHLQTIYAKTGVRSQAGLVRLALMAALS